MLLCQEQWQKTGADSCMIMHTLTQWTSSGQSNSTYAGRYWSIQCTVRILTQWLSHPQATEAGTQGMPIPVRKSNERSCLQLFPAAAFTIHSERHPALGGSVKHASECKWSLFQWAKKILCNGPSLHYKHNDKPHCSFIFVALQSQSSSHDFRPDSKQKKHVWSTSPKLDFFFTTHMHTPILYHPYSSYVWNQFLAALESVTHISLIWIALLSGVTILGNIYGLMFKYLYF